MEIINQNLVIVALEKDNEVDIIDEINNKIYRNRGEVLAKGSLATEIEVGDIVHFSDIAGAKCGVGLVALDFRELLFVSPDKNLYSTFDDSIFINDYSNVEKICVL